MTGTATEPSLSIPLDYIETTVAAGLTIGEYRRSRPRRPRRWERFKELAGAAGVACTPSLTPQPR